MATYRPEHYSYNGPELLTRVLNRFCGEKDVHNMTEKACQGFSVLPQDLCYNLNYGEWPLLFDEKKTEEIMERLKNSIVIHYWTSLSKNFKFRSNMKNAFTEYGKRLCPKVMSAVGEYIT